VLSVLLRYTDSDYPFGIFKLFYVSEVILMSARHSRHHMSEYGLMLRIKWNLYSF